MSEFSLSFLRGLFSFCHITRRTPLLHVMDQDSLSLTNVVTFSILIPYGLPIYFEDRSENSDRKILVPTIEN